jgi:rhomboid family GlyGly-CTERM serine protease
MTAGDLGGPGPGREPGARFFGAPLALLVTLAALLAALVPGAAEALELERARVAGGELWRLLSGHLVHYSREHLVLDALAFLALGLACERRAPRRTALALAAAALAIPLAVLTLQPELARYRGLSGLDSALFGLLLGLEARAGARRAWLAGALLAAKLGWELASGQALFVDSVAQDFVPVPLAHALGALLGLACAFLRLAPARAMTTLGGPCPRLPSPSPSSGPSASSAR